MKIVVAKTSVVVLSAVLLAAASLQHQSVAAEQQRQQTTPPANSMPVKVMKVGDTATLGGVVIASREVTLAAQMPGRVRYIAGAEGTPFKRGAELLRIDADEMLAQQRAAWADYQNARLAARNARVQYNRELWSPQSNNINRMAGMGMPAMFDSMFTRNWAGMFDYYYNPDVQRYSDLYAQGTQLGQSNARVMQARARLDELAAKLRDTRSIAPFDGVIAYKLVEVGDTVQPGQPLLVFVNLQRLQVKVEAPARLMPALQDAKHATVRLDNPRKTLLQGRIVRQYPVADSERHTVTVKIDLGKNAPAIPGMYAQVIVPETGAQKYAQIVIPSKAIISRKRGSLPAVYIWNPHTQRKERRYIRLGTRVDGENVAVLSGLSQHDTLVIE